MRRSRVPLVLLGALALVVLATGCAALKPGSLKVTQPSGIGAVHVHMSLCTAEYNTTEFTLETCVAEGGSEREGQDLLAFTVPDGAPTPGTITAVGVGSAPTLTYTKNKAVAEAMAKLEQSEEEEKEGKQWPPAGTEIVGYMSNAVVEHPGTSLEWNLDAEVGLPPAGDGGANAVDFPVRVAYGWQEVKGSEYPAGRAPECSITTAGAADCALGEETVTGHTSDLKVGTPSASSVFPGASATLSFGLNAATTVSPAPSFSFSGTTTVPGGTLSFAPSSYVPSGMSGSGNRASAATETVTVGVPAGTGPGTYSVTLTATAPGGGTVTQSGSVTVSNPKFGVKVKKRPNGTASLSVKVPGAGTLTLAGKGIKKVTRNATGPKTLKLAVVTVGKKKAQLRATGKARVKLKITFKPSSGAAVTMTKSLVLKKR